MRNEQSWRPSRVVKGPKAGTFVTLRAGMYGGSLHIAELQHTAYVPLLQEHISGHVLDIGCGLVPYHEVL